MNKNKYLIFMLVFTILFSIIAPSFTLAAGATSNEPILEPITVEEVAGEREVTFTEVNDNKMEYTYEENGEQYKNVEHIDDTTNVVTTYIYKLDPVTQEYVLQEDLVTTVTEETITVETNGETTVHENPYVQESVANDGSYSTSWVYRTTYYSSSKASQFTLAAIAVTVGMISKLHWTVKWVSQIAALYFSFGKDIVYYKSVYYDKGSGLSKDTRITTTMYKDSSRTKAFGVTCHIQNRYGSTHQYAYLY